MREGEYMEIEGDYRRKHMGRDAKMLCRDLQQDRREGPSNVSVEMSLRRGSLTMRRPNMPCPCSSLGRAHAF